MEKIIAPAGSVVILGVSWLAARPVVTEIDRLLRSGYIEVETQGNYVYAAVSDGLEVFDISNPQSPQSPAVIGIPGDWTRGIAPNGRRLHVLTNVDGTSILYIVNITGPGARR